MSSTAVVSQLLRSTLTAEPSNRASIWVTPPTCHAPKPAPVNDVVSVKVLIMVWTPDTSHDATSLSKVDAPLKA